MCFGLINYYYYGQKSICFSETDCNNFVNELFKTYGTSKGYIYSNNSPQVFLQRDLESISNIIFSVASNKIGLTSTATGPASNIKGKRTNEYTNKEDENNINEPDIKKKKTNTGGRTNKIQPLKSRQTRRNKVSLNTNNNFTKSNKIQQLKSRQTRRKN
jgi:hypothetical protein